MGGGDCGRARVFSNHFGNVYTVEVPSLSVHTSLHTHSEHCDNVFDLINKLYINKSMGPDEMHPGLLRELEHFFANPSSVCFSLSVT